jgi:DNA-directed RNA polymerase delta subunit
MKLKEMSKEELEVLSYTDLTELILKENKKAMNTPSIFKKICDLLELTEEDYANQIGDYYTSLTTDKRFILLDTAEWDLKDKHKVEINLDEEDEDEEVFDDEESEDEEELEEVEDESIEVTDDEVDLDDGMEDLTIVDDEDLEEEM